MLIIAIASLSIIALLVALAAKVLDDQDLYVPLHITKLQPAFHQIRTLATPLAAGGGGGIGASVLLAALQLFSSGSTVELKFREPIWNVWTERFSEAPTFQPTTLEPEQDYSLIVNLAGLGYADSEGASVFSRDVSSPLSRWLDLHSDATSVDLALLVFPDNEHIQLADEKVKPLRVDLTKMRKAKQEGFKLADSPFRVLKSYGSKAPFSFGIQSFRIRSTAQAGVGSVAIAVWAEGKPIDELSLSLCIVRPGGDPCPAKPVTNKPHTGGGLAMGASSDFALQLLERDKHLVGVLRCNTCGWDANAYREWEIGETVDWLSKRMNEIAGLIGKDTSPQTLEDAGNNIYHVIFRSRNRNDLSQATGPFGDFLAAARAQEQDGNNKGKALSLFVRIMPDRPDLVLLPIGLMRVELPDKSSEFLGFDVNIQTPLEYQDYSVPPGCISDWVLFVPPDSKPVPFAMKEVSDAREEFKDWIADFKRSCRDCVKDDVKEFERWLGRKSEASASYAVLILSHHSANALSFDPYAGVKILSSSVTRLFATPSFVILDACGTSEPSSSEFIRQFNYQGVSSVIATSTQVEPALAGQFLATFMRLLREHADDKDYSVSRARFETVRALGRKPGNQGPKALTFVLVGNGGLRLCVPPAADAAH